MTVDRFKCLLVAAFSVFSLFFSSSVLAQNDKVEKTGHETEQKEEHDEKKKEFNAAEVIFGHVLNGHEFHFMEISGHPVTIPLPVILYSPQRGLTTFMSSRFEHGHKTYGGMQFLLNTI